MKDRGAIITGLVIFLGLLTFPIWYIIGPGHVGTPPAVELPAGMEHCVLDTQEMRDAHMALLNQWRDEVVRDGERFFTEEDGYYVHESLLDPAHPERGIEKSLSKTCLGCHTNKAEFCDKCHDYAGVTPYCWDCHVIPQGG